MKGHPRQNQAIAAPAGQRGGIGGLSHPDQPLGLSHREGLVLQPMARHQRAANRAGRIKRPAVVAAHQLFAPHPPHRQRQAPVGAGFGDGRRLAALGAKEHQPLPRQGAGDRLAAQGPAGQQRLPVAQAVAVAAGVGVHRGVDAHQQESSPA